tara:strand:+ start:5328 stop:5852 length:525 start_codon:yes stop_codon:yes gene_type:complete
MALTLLATTLQAGEPVAAPPAEAVAGIAAVTAPEAGRFRVINWLWSGPGVTREVRFTLETAPALDGAGLRTQWRDAETGSFVGELTRTQDPASGEWVQHWFSAASGQWSVTRQSVQVYEDGYGTAFSGEDGHGPFDVRTRTTHLATGGYDWIIERRYPGTDWFVVDRGEARPAD